MLFVAAVDNETGNAQPASVSNRPNSFLQSFVFPILIPLGNPWRPFVAILCRQPLWATFSPESTIRRFNSSVKRPQGTLRELVQRAAFGGVVEKLCHPIC
jgi:hypothetical protein